MTVEARTPPQVEVGRAGFSANAVSNWHWKILGCHRGGSCYQTGAFRVLAHGLGDDQGTCCSPLDIALRIPRITARFFRNSLHHKGELASA
jgi:hypothetical protein